MKLVEVIRGIATSDETWARTRALAEALGKTALECHDSPGFVSNRVLMPMIYEAVFALHSRPVQETLAEAIAAGPMRRVLGRRPT